MSRLLEQIREAGVCAWLRVLSLLNQLILYVCAAAAAVYVTNKPMVDAVIAKLPGPGWQLVGTIAFATFIQFAIARAKKTQA
jgi:hypothetical protein